MNIVEDLDKHLKCIGFNCLSQPLSKRKVYLMNGIYVVVSEE